MASNSLPEAAEKMRKNVTKKLSGMKANYDAAKGRMKSNYPTYFGPARRSAYSSAIDTADYRAPDVGKMVDRWQKKMSE